MRISDWSSDVCSSDLWPSALSTPRYWATAARAPRPAYQARSAARAAVPGNSFSAFAGLETRVLFTIASLVDRHGYCDKKDYLNRIVNERVMRPMQFATALSFQDTAKCMPFAVFNFRQPY